MLALVVSGSAPSTRAETTSASGATAITSIPANGLTISNPGTYYLAADLTINADIAFAINVTSPYVTIDFNGHTLTQLYTNDNGTLGICVIASNVTIRNGAIVGFLEAIDLHSDNCCIEDVFAAESTYHGILVAGNNHIVRGCRVNNTGASTKPQLAVYAVGIFVSGPSNSRVTDCDVTTLTPGPGCYTICIYISGVQNAVVVNNRFGGGVYGLVFDNGSTGKYRDNLSAADVAVPYLSTSSSSGTDAGNNP